MSRQKYIRNFSIIAHIDHGKSTLADRMLEITKTVEARRMRAQVLDAMDLERERGITIKMQPVRMEYHSDRRIDADGTQKVAEVINANSIRTGAEIEANSTQNNAEEKTDFLYPDLTYTIRGALFAVRKTIGLGHKEQVYHHALEIEFKKAGLSFESRKNIPLLYEGKIIGHYQPDFVIEEKVLIELKALPEIGRPQTEQVWSYLKGCNYKVALLANFGSTELDIKRIVYDTARPSADSASSLRSSAGVSNQIEDQSYILNLIDTPGHIDFAYEVSRALTAVEGVILLIDATQGIQAQTLATLGMAKDAGCAVIPVLSKIDSPLARIPETKSALAELLRIPEEEIFLVSGKTGEGVERLLQGIVLKVPPPKSAYEGQGGRALVFDFEYSEHRGVVAFVRVVDGSIRPKDKISLTIFKRNMTALETGWFLPAETPADVLSAGEIGYVVTGIKEPGIALVGDTMLANAAPLPPLPGYRTPRPVVWASLYPESQDGFTLLKQALQRLKLSDAALSFEEDGSAVLGKGFRCGFLGMLHMEIITERLKREFSQTPVITTPSIAYEITDTKGKISTVFTAAAFPDDGSAQFVREQWIAISIITPPEYLSPLTQLLYEYEAVTNATDLLGDNRMMIQAEMPLRELMRGFFDRLKSVTSGFASLSYEFADLRPAAVTRLDVLVAEEGVPALTRVVSKRRVEEEARAVVERLAKTLPRQMFVLKIQAKAQGRIIASRSLSAMRKDVTGYLYGGDVTRKKKLLEKQKKGKERRGEYKKVNIPQEVFLKMIRPEN